MIFSITSSESNFSLSVLQYLPERNNFWLRKFSKVLQRFFSLFHSVPFVFRPRSHANNEVIRGVITRPTWMGVETFPFTEKTQLFQKFTVTEQLVNGRIQFRRNCKIFPFFALFPLSFRISSNERLFLQKFHWARRIYLGNNTRSLSKAICVSLLFWSVAKTSKARPTIENEED